jgi:hypothetical protein
VPWLGAVAGAGGRGIVVPGIDGSRVWMGLARTATNWDELDPNLAQLTPEQEELRDVSTRETVDESWLPLQCLCDLASYLDMSASPLLLCVKCCWVTVQKVIALEASKAALESVAISLKVETWFNLQV